MDKNERIKDFVLNEIKRIEGMLLPDDPSNWNPNIKILRTKIPALEADIKVYAETISDTEDEKLILIDYGNRLLNEHRF